MTDNNEYSLEERKEASLYLKTVNGAQQEVYELPEKQSSRSLLWSVLSLIFGIISILVCQIWPLAIVLAASSLGLAVFARYRLGYFDKAALFGLIISIIGIVFGIFSAVVTISGVFNALV